MKQLLKPALLLLLLLLLVLVRAMEKEFFYDPFMLFYDREVLGIEVQAENSFLLYLNVVFRYVINTLISLAVLFVVFRDKGIIRFSSVLYLVIFFMLFPAFVLLMGKVGPGNYLQAFYVRRFLIHPVLILLLLPAFFYQRLQGKAQ